jgi:hypothetical protein
MVFRTSFRWRNNSESTGRSVGIEGLWIEGGLELISEETWQGRWWCLFQSQAGCPLSCLDTGISPSLLLGK